MARSDIDILIAQGRERGLFQIEDDQIFYTNHSKDFNFADPEEKVRAAVYAELVLNYEYSPQKMDVEVLVPRRQPGDYADIVIYSDDEQKENYAVVETKKIGVTEAQFSQAIEQGFGNANSLRSQFLIVDSFTNRKVFRVAEFPPNERAANVVGDLPENYGLVPNYLYSRGGTNDLDIVDFNALSHVFKKCHNIIWSGGKLDPSTAFDEMSKILFAKIHDERNTANGETYKLQIGTNENEVIVAKRVIETYEEARALDTYVFTEQIRVSDIKIQQVIRLLQSISLSETDLDSKGQAFEEFLGVVFRGELGQYFTRRQIVEFAVSLLEPVEEDLVIDPSCGSGGFLLYSMKQVHENIEKKYKGNLDLIARKKFDFSHQRIFGIEINAKIARVSMMDMIVNEDGHSNIENNTGLNSEFKNDNIAFGRFTLLMTNPPFGVTINRDDRDNLGLHTFPDFEFGGSRKNQVSDILFLEQYKNFLTSDIRKNPRAGVVLQTGVLNNPSFVPVLTWLRRNFRILAVVSLPIFAFRKAGSGMKTCLLFLRKYEKEYDLVEDVPDYSVFFGIANHIGYDSTLRPDKNDFPDLLKHYRNKTEDKNKGVFWLNLSELDYRLDPNYYYSKFIVQNEFDRLRSKGHKLLPLGDLLSSFESGKSPDGGVTRSVGEIPSITISNITSDGALDFSDTLNFVPDDFAAEFATQKGELKLFDILVAKDGATTGKTAIVDEAFPFLTDEEPPTPRAIFSEHIFRLSLKPGISSMYVHAYLNSDLGQLQLDMITSGGAQGGITRDFVDQIYVPVVSHDIQAEIAETWLKGMVKAAEAKRLYSKTVSDVKESVEESTLESAPITEEELEILLGEDS